MLELGFTLHIGAPCTELQEWLCGYEINCWTFLTAWNPGAKQLPEAENRIRNQNLEKEIKEMGFRPYSGLAAIADASWPAEESYWVPGLCPNLGLDLAAKYGQLAIVGAVPPFGIPSLFWVDL